MVGPKMQAFCPRIDMLKGTSPHYIPLIRYIYIKYLPLICKKLLNSELPRHKSNKMSSI